MIRKKIAAVPALLGAATAAAVLASAAPGHAVAAPRTSAVANTTCYPYYVYVFTGNGVNIHQYPALGSAGGAVYGLGYSGQEFDSRRGTVNNEGYTWVYGTDRSTGVTGWAVTRYLRYLYNDGTCLF